MSGASTGGIVPSRASKEHRVALAISHFPDKKLVWIAGENLLQAQDSAESRPHNQADIQVVAGFSGSRLAVPSSGGKKKLKLWRPVQG
jgi:hypothetical protein